MISVIFLLIVGAVYFFFFQAEDGIRDDLVTGVQTCALPIFGPAVAPSLTGYITATTGNSLYSTYLIVGAYLLSGMLLLIIVKAADPNEALNEPAVETGLAS